jgi:phospholipid/cholesterol/gamma-HCH transport system ATP-binding protein
MPALTATPILSLRGVMLEREHRAASPGAIDLELGRGQLAVIEVPDEDAASGLVDLCVGLVDPPAGTTRFLDRAWQAQSYRERLDTRSRIGAVIGTRTWPPHLPIAEAMLMAPLYHGDRAEEDVAHDATVMARLFDLPGLPAGRPETTPPGELVRAACVRGFLGNPDLVVIHDPVLDQMAALAVALAQVIAAAQDRGGAILWIVTSAAAPAARFVQPDLALRLGDRGLVSMRRSS